MLLRDKDRLALIQFFREVPLPIAVWAYGSRVNGTAHVCSDLDLVLRTPTLQPLPAAQMAALRKRIRESNIPILVELHDWATLPERFRENIGQRHEVLYEATPAA